jgi:hypothetical protein
MALFLLATGGDLAEGINGPAKLPIKPSQKKYIERYLEMQKQINQDVQTYLSENRNPNEAERKRWVEFEDLLTTTIRYLGQSKYFARTSWVLVTE